MPLAPTHSRNEATNIEQHIHTQLCRFIWTVVEYWLTSSPSRWICWALHRAIYRRWRHRFLVSSSSHNNRITITSSRSTSTTTSQWHSIASSCLTTLLLLLIPFVRRIVADSCLGARRPVLPRPAAPTMDLQLVPNSSRAAARSKASRLLRVTRSSADWSRCSKLQRCSPGVQWTHPTVSANTYRPISLRSWNVSDAFFSILFIFVVYRLVRWQQHSLPVNQRPIHLAASPSRQFVGLKFDERTPDGLSRSSFLQ